MSLLTPSETHSTIILPSSDCLKLVFRFTFNTTTIRIPLRNKIRLKIICHLTSERCCFSISFHYSTTDPSDFKIHFSQTDIGRPPKYSQVKSQTISPSFGRKAVRKPLTHAIIHRRPSMTGLCLKRTGYYNICLSSSIFFKTDHCRRKQAVFSLRAFSPAAGFKKLPAEIIRLLSPAVIGIMKEAWATYGFEPVHMSGSHSFHPSFKNTSLPGFLVSCRNKHVPGLPGRR